MRVEGEYREGGSAGAGGGRGIEAQKKVSITVWTPEGGCGGGGDV
jgi:hypothetical protein